MPVPLIKTAFYFQPRVLLSLSLTHKPIKVKAKEIRKEIGEGIEIILPRITKCVLYIVIGNPMVA